MLLSKLTNEQTLSCEGIISEEEVFEGLKPLENNKSPGNDRLFKEFYECFSDEIKKPFFVSIHKVFLHQELSTSQKQALIKILEKRDKDKRIVKKGRSISLLNIDMIIISKVILTRKKKVLPILFFSNQT